MSICPWCKGQMPSATDVCALCGKRPAEHPSIASSGYATFGAFDDFDEAPGGLPSESQPAGQAAVRMHDDMFDNLGGDDAPGSSHFEIAADPKARPKASVTAAPPQQASVGSTANTDLAGSAGPGTPGGDSLAQEPGIDPYELAILADFGPAPEQIYLTPIYAWRVLTRKRELRRRHALAVSATAEARRQRDDQLAALAARARPRLEKSADFATLMAPLVEAERRGQERSGALEQRSAEFGQSVAGVDQRIADAQQQIRVAQGVVDSARAVLKAREDVLKRVQALCKRIEIEIRNTQDLARAAAGPNAKTAPPEFGARILELQRELDEKKRDVLGPQAAYDQALTEVQDAERQLSALERGARTLRAERDKLEQAFTREAGMRSEGVQHAESEQRAALIAIGSRLVEAQIGLLDPADRDAYQSAQGLLSSRSIEAEKLLRAAASENRGAVKKGWIVIGVAATLLLGLLVALIAAFGTSQPA